MNRWVLFFIAVIGASLAAAIVYHLPMYFKPGSPEDDARALSLVLQTVFFALYPIIPLSGLTLLSDVLCEKYDVELRFEIAINAGISLLIFALLYYWIWTNLPTYSITPTLTGTAVFTFLRYRSMTHWENGEDEDSPSTPDNTNPS